MKLQAAAELVAEYVASARQDTSDGATHGPCRLIHVGFGTAVGRSWPLAATESWVRLDIVSLSRMNVPLPLTGQPSLLQQLKTRRSLLEFISQLIATPSFRWRESFESLWWPSLLRPTDFQDDKYLEAVQNVERRPRFALSMGRPTLESMHLFFQFLQMDHKALLTEENWQLLKGLRTPTKRRERQCVDICLRLADNVVDTSILRSLVDGMGDYLATLDKEEAEEDYPKIEYKITDLWFNNCRFLNGAEDLALLAQVVTLPLSTIRCLMLPGAFFNSLRNPAGLESFQSFARKVVAPSSPLRSLDLTRVGIDSNCVGALCSALRYPSQLQKLSIGHTIRGAHTNSRLVWAWIFLAVFHVDSGCELEHFDVSGLQLQAQDVELLAAMLDSPHPGRTLVLLLDGRFPEGEGCEECELPPNERLFVRLLDGSQAWTSPGNSAVWPQLLPGTLQTTDFEYEVMVRLTDWLCILIPGYGFGWVVSSAVRYELTTGSRVAKLPGESARTKLQSLTYRGLQEQSGGVMDLLRHIGHSLTSLDVPQCGLDSRDLDTLVDICPNLSRLNVTGNIMADLSPLLRAYAENRCQLTQLGVFVESVSATTAAQIQALLVHPNSKCLESLQLDAIAHGADCNHSEEAIWTGIERALSVNTTLRRVYLSLPSAASYEAATAWIKPLHGKILRYETPSRLKAAFLSVVEQASSSRSVSLLDHMVLSMIFSFATTSAIRRQVNVRH